MWNLFINFGQLYSQVTHKKKSWTHEIPTRRNFVPTKYLLGNTFGKRTRTRKIFGPTKYLRENIPDPQRYDGTMTRDPRNLTYSYKT